MCCRTCAFLALLCSEVQATTCRRAALAQKPNRKVIPRLWETGTSHRAACCNAHIPSPARGRGWRAARAPGEGGATCLARVREGPPHPASAMAHALPSLRNPLPQMRGRGAKQINRRRTPLAPLPLAGEGGARHARRVRVTLSPELLARVRVVSSPARQRYW